MNFISILTTILQAFLVRNYSFPVRVGATHFQVTITETATPGSTKWGDAAQIAIKVLSGAEGTFQIGVFSVAIVKIAAVAEVHVAPQVATRANVGPTTP